MDKLEDLKDSDLIVHYGKIVKQLRIRKIIRTKNVVCDLGERFVIDIYTQSPTLENLSHTPPSTKNIDAINEQGNRYAIKSIRDYILDAR